MKTAIVLGVICGLTALPAVAQARSLRDQLGGASQTVGLAGGTAFDALADTIANTAARSLPVVSASAGFTYRFNPTLEVFERTSDTLGPIFLERPDTLGRSKLNLNVSFHYVEFNAFDGTSLGRLEAPDPIVTSVVDGAGNPLGFTANRLRYDLTIRNYVTALSATYGLLDALDVNLLLPLIETTLDTNVHSQQVAIAGPGGGFAASVGPPLSGSTSGDAFGVGDLLLRLKYRMPDCGDLRWATGLQLRLPTGREENFQGGGSFEASPGLFAAWHGWRGVEPHANIAVDARADDVSRSEGRWGLGVDFDLIPQLGGALGILGRHEFSRSADRRDTDFLHLNGGRVVQEPLLGLEFDRKDFVDLSFGVRAVVWRQVMLFANGLYAINNDGLRNDTIIPSVGVEGTF